jgi:hypothetical protein
MQATRTTSIDRAFVLHPDQIRRVFGVINEHGGQCKIASECVGGLSLEPASIDELLSVPNTGSYKIRTLKLASWGAPTISVTFTLDSGAPIQIHLSGEDAEVVKVSERLEREILQARKGPWPDILDSLWVDKMYLGYGQFAGLVGTLALGPVGPLKPGISYWAFFGRFLLAYCLFTIAAAAFLWIICSKVYPKGIFLIGAGVHEYESLRNRRQQLSIWTLIAGVAAAAVFTVIQYWAR